MTVDDILDSVLRAEGGYVNDPADAGGETMFGITRTVARANGWTGPMRDLSRGKALEIYRHRYVTEPGFDAVLAVSPEVAAELVDTGVNMGPATAVRFLQRALNAFNLQGRAYPDVAADGQCGPGTVAALAAFKARRGQEGIAVLLRAMNALQGARYVELCEARPANEAFAFGWFAQRVA